MDVWLDVACLFKTRSEAQRACKGGKVEVNAERAKPHRDLKVGDQVGITRSRGRRQIVRVTRLADAHIAKALARELYVDVTPPPTPEEQALLDLLKMSRPMPTSSAAPSRRDQRTRRRLKEAW